MTAEDRPSYLDRFEITRELGRGGMGVVYLARQKSLNRDVAIKVLTAEHKQTESMIKRFEREATNLVQLKHPNLVHLYDFELIGSHPYLVFEFIEGERTLADSIAASQYTDDEALVIVLELASVVAYLHESGIVHRDLKPANILMDRQGHVRLADFGLSRDLDPGSTRVTLEGQVVGTYAYMPPEAFFGARGAESCDVYAFGLIAFELFARRILFGGQAPEIAPSQRAKGGLPFLSQYYSRVPEALDTLVTRCVAHAAAHRPRNACDVLLALSQIVDARLGKGFGQTQTLKLQIEKYSGRQPVVEPPSVAASDAVTVAMPAPQPVPNRIPKSALLVALALVGTVLASGAWVKGRGGRALSSPSSTVALAEVRSPAADCSPLRPGVLVALTGLLGDDGDRMDRILERLRSLLKAAGAEGAFRDLLALALGGKELARLEEQLRLAGPIVRAHGSGTSVDHALLSQLNLLETFDELAVSLGEQPLFERELARLRGPFAAMKELAPIEGEPVLAYRAQSFKGPERTEWRLDAPPLPSRDAELTFVVNDLDPKAILEVNVNGVVRLNYRNRSGIAGAANYVVPACRVAGATSPPLPLGPSGPFPKFTVLTRRVPRSALRAGENRLRLRFVVLPGPLKLPDGRVWQTSSKLSYGCIWHAYLTFP